MRGFISIILLVSSSSYSLLDNYDYIWTQDEIFEVLTLGGAFSETILETPERVPQQLPKKYNHLWHRNEIVEIVDEYGLSVGVEVGVKQGTFANDNLINWKNLKLYFLVDIWHSQINYYDKANVDDQVQKKYYDETISKCKPFGNKTVTIRALSVDAAKLFPDEIFDYVYLDARHDYCGVTEDLNAYYPKLKKGGVLAGHDFLTAYEAFRMSGGAEIWSVCSNGTHHEGGVKKAVEDFAKLHGIPLYHTRDRPQSWYAVK